MHQRRRLGHPAGLLHDPLMHKPVIGINGLAHAPLHEALLLRVRHHGNVADREAGIDDNRIQDAVRLVEQPARGVGIVVLRVVTRPNGKPVHTWQNHHRQRLVR